MARSPTRASLCLHVPEQPHTHLPELRDAVSLAEICACGAPEGRPSSAALPEPGTDPAACGMLPPATRSPAAPARHQHSVSTLPACHVHAMAVEEEAFHALKKRGRHLECQHSRRALSSLDCWQWERLWHQCRCCLVRPLGGAPVTAQPAFKGMNAFKLNRLTHVAFRWCTVHDPLQEHSSQQSWACAVLAPSSAHLAHFWGTGRTFSVFWHAGCWTISSGRAATGQNRPRYALCL